MIRKKLAALLQWLTAPAPLPSVRDAQAQIAALAAAMMGA